jgi:Peptidase_C39 like family
MNRTLPARLAVLTAGSAVALAAVVGTAAPASAGPAPAGSIGYPGALDAVGAWKQAHDTIAHPAPSVEQAALLAKKDQRAAASAARPASIATGDYALPPNQQGQTKSYWCGPAAVAEALNLRGVNISQATAADILNTDTSGTAWYGVNADVAHPTSYPIPDVLNHYTNAGYVPVGLAYTPSASDISTYKSRLLSNINTGYPLVGNGWEVTNGPHLAGHPNIVIYHWFTIRGYSQFGDQTQYEDSATTVWSTVPAYQTMSTSTIITILGGRGYVW